VTKFVNLGRLSESGIEKTKVAKNENDINQTQTVSKKRKQKTYEKRNEVKVDGISYYTFSDGSGIAYYQKIDKLCRYVANNDNPFWIYFAPTKKLDGKTLAKMKRAAIGETLSEETLSEESAQKFLERCHAEKKWGEEAWNEFGPAILAAVNPTEGTPRGDAETEQVRPPKSTTHAETNLIWTLIAEWAEEFGLHVSCVQRPPCFNLILEGVPGTGKTYSLNKLREEFARNPNLTVVQKEAAVELGQGRFAMTMHPATAYEDFVEGLRPGAPSLPTFPDGEKPQAHGYGDENTVWFFTNSANDKPKSNPTQTTGFQVHDGFFVRVCREAVHYPDRVFVVLLDEINRCNIPKVMGDLLTTIEASKRARYDKSKKSWDTSKVQVMTLPYSQRRFFVPDNVVVVGTMNTTDRSVAPMDAALRRRFAFARVYPQGFGIGQTLDNAWKQLTDYPIKAEDKATPAVIKRALEHSWALWSALNNYLRKFGEDALLGHSYLYDLRDVLRNTPQADHAAVTISQWNMYILPQLVDVLVSNDLMSKVLVLKQGNSGKYEFETKEKAGTDGKEEPQTSNTAGILNKMLSITVNGKGLLRTPNIRFVKQVDPEPPSAIDGPVDSDPNTAGDVSES
jgi:MoxR-like ATPase